MLLKPRIPLFGRYVVRLDVGSSVRRSSLAPRSGVAEMLKTSEFSGIVSLGEAISISLKAPLENSLSEEVLKRPQRRRRRWSVECEYGSMRYSLRSAEDRTLEECLRTVV